MVAKKSLVEVRIDGERDLLLQPSAGSQPTDRSIQQQKMVVQAVVPALNEGNTIEMLLKDLNRYVDAVLLMDGHSKDETAELAKNLGAEVILQRGTGKGQALREAFELAKGNIIVMLDADGSMRPEEIPLMVKAILDGADVVKCSRFLKGGGSEDISRLRKLGNSFFAWLVNLFWSSNYTDLCYGFAAFRSEALMKLTPLIRSERFELETELFIKAKKLGLRVVELPSVELMRRDGKSNLRTFRDGFGILRTIFRELRSVEEDKI